MAGDATMQLVVSDLVYESLPDSATTDILIDRRKTMVCAAPLECHFLKRCINLVCIQSTCLLHNCAQNAASWVACQMIQGCIQLQPLKNVQYLHLGCSYSCLREVQGRWTTELPFGWVQNCGS